MEGYMTLTLPNSSKFVKTPESVYSSEVYEKVDSAVDFIN